MTERISPIIVATIVNEKYQIITFGGLENWINGQHHSEQSMIDKTIVCYLGNRL